VSDSPIEKPRGVPASREDILQSLIDARAALFEHSKCRTRRPTSRALADGSLIVAADTYERVVRISYEIGDMGDAIDASNRQ
jgi:hypothetical protein